MAKDNDFVFYSDFSKVDEEQRMVYGLATTDVIDSQDEIVEWEATNKAAKDYSNWRNIREMHSNSAVGTAPVLEMQKQGLWVGAKIVDDSAWKKVKAGVYKGFSIGGKKLKVVPDFDASLGKQINRIKEYILTEISLVDRPANPLATFSFVKINVNSSEVEDMKDIKKDVALQEESLEKTASTEEVKTEEIAPIAKSVEALEEVAAVPEEIKKEAKPAEETKEELAVEKTVSIENVEKSVDMAVESESVSEDMVSVKKSEYDALVKDASLAKKQDELIDMLKCQIEKAFASEEPKELVEKKANKPKSIGEVSMMKGGWLSLE
jgi:hypothetical protein